MLPTDSTHLGTLLGSARESDDRSRHPRDVVLRDENPGSRMHAVAEPAVSGGKAREATGLRLGPPPPCRVATTGGPLACASTATSPRLSASPSGAVQLGITTRSASASARRTASGSLPARTSSARRAPSAR